MQTAMDIFKSLLPKTLSDYQRRTIIAQVQKEGKLAYIIFTCALEAGKQLASQQSAEAPISKTEDFVKA
jgi:hypothetical protein